MGRNYPYRFHCRKITFQFPQFGLYNPPASFQQQPSAYFHRLLAIKAMAKIGIDISEQKSKHTKDY